MSDKPAQSYATHRRFVPGYHYLLTALILLLAGRAVYLMITAFSWDAVFDLLVAIAIQITALYARLFPLKAQDRLIRNEERERLIALLPADLHPRIPELRTGHLVALRFASDEELPELARRVLDGELTGQNEIKKAIRSWRGDYCRV